MAEISGDNGNNNLAGASGDDLLNGLGGNDLLEGNGGADTLLGGAGADTLIGGAGNDVLDGGAITDTVNYTDLNWVRFDGATEGVEVDLEAGEAYDGQGGTDSLTNINWVTGTQYDDTILGSTSSLFEQFEGGAGDDYIDGGAIAGTQGNRVSYLVAGGGAVNVNLATNSATGQGNDQLFNISQVRGSNEGDVLTGSNQVGYVEGFDGRGGNDTIDGGGGIDEIRVEGAAFGASTTVDLVTGIVSDGLGGTDTISNIEWARGGNSNDTLIGDSGANQLQGMNGNDSLVGDAGNDTLRGGAGVDTLVGGEGDDIIDGGAGPAGEIDWAGFGTATGPMTINLQVGTATGLGNDTLIGIEAATGGSGNDTLTGSDGTNFLRGNGGDDLIDGGLGFDWIDYGVATGSVTVNIETGTSSGADGVDDFSNIEAIRGSAHGDHLTGDGTDNWFRGNGGIDTVDGAGGFDTIDYRESAEGVTVTLTGDFAGGYDPDELANIEAVYGSGLADSINGNDGANRIDGQVGDDYLYGDGGADTVIGGAGNDFVDGGQDNDTLVGGAGDDTLWGGTGDDRIEAGGPDGLGNDSIYGGEGVDVVSYQLSSATAGVTFVSTGSGVEGRTQADGTGGTDYLQDIEQVHVFGSGFNDQITGDDGFNHLQGNGGNDTLTGNGGNDNFGWDIGTQSGIDTVTDLQAGGALFFNQFNGPAFEITSVAAGDDPAGLARGQVLVGTPVEGVTRVYVGTSGGAQPHIEIVLQGEFSAADFAVQNHPWGAQLRHSPVVDFTGGDDDDNVSGGSGADTLRGNGGNDQLFGNEGNDVLDGGSGNDQLFSNAGDDSVLGGEGDDYLHGGGGWDGGGNDTFDGGAGYDTVGYGFLGAEGPITFVATGASGTQNDGQGGTDQLVGIEEVHVFGTNAGDTITGDAQRNYIQGNGGNDTLAGGTGSDTFAYDVAIANGIDRIQDFGGGDNISLNNVWVETTLQTGDDASALGMGGVMLGSTQGGVTRLYIGTDSVAGADLQIDLAGTYTAANLQLFNSPWGASISYTTPPPPVSGSEGPDNLWGTESGDTIDGLGGNDTLLGFGGSDHLTGGAGNDQLIGHDGNDTLIGGGGQDIFNGGSGNDSIDGGTITDLVNYTDLNWVRFEGATTGVVVNLQAGTAQDGQGGTDSLTNINWVSGTEHDDSITGSTANIFEQFEGGFGNDTIDGGTVAGTPGNRVSFAIPGGTAVTVNLGTNSATGQGNDVLLNITQVRGSDQGDTLIGSDTTAYIENFEGRGGNDTIDGAGGQDDVRYDFTGSAVNVNLATGIATDGFFVNGVVGTDSLSNIEHARGSAWNDTLTGSAGANRLQGLGGDDSIDGGMGDDTLLGGDGSDTINGGAGNDSLDGGNNLPGLIDLVRFTTSADLVVNLATGTATGDGSDTLANFEGVISGSGNDSITGGAAGEFLRGNAGNDTIDGGAGDDWADYRSATGAVTVSLATNSSSGADGVDQLSNMEAIRGGAFGDTLTGDGAANYIRGMAGNDTIDGGGGFDTADYWNATGGVQVSLAQGGSEGADGADTLLNMEGVRGSLFNDDIEGDDGANRLDGNLGNDDLMGGAGNDTLLGGGGNDELAGDAGDDTIDGGDGYDRLVFDFYDATSGVTFVLEGEDDESGGTWVADGFGGVDYVINVEEANIWGSTHADNFTGDDGDTWIEGLEGNDTLTGGGGDDTFAYFVSENSGVDRITDFGAGDQFYFEQDYDGEGPLFSLTSVTAGDSAGALGRGEVMIGSAIAGVTRVYVGVDDVAGADLTIELNGSFHAGSFTIANNDWASYLRYEPGQVFTGGDESDHFNGGTGNDSASGLGGSDHLFGHGGYDTLDGGEGNDYLFGGEGNDSLRGGGGDDQLNGEPGSDTLDGGAGWDTATYSFSYGSAGGGAVNFNATGASGTINDGLGGTDTLVSVESVHVIGTEYGDTIAGDSQFNWLMGAGGNDTLTGGVGADTFAYNMGGNGVDRITDFTSQDTLQFNSVNLTGPVLAGDDASALAQGRVMVGSTQGGVTRLYIGTDSVAGADVTVDLVGSFDAGRFNVLGQGWGSTVTYTADVTPPGPGTPGNDSLQGTSGNDALDGIGGNDTIDGLGGDDTLSGGAGNDSLLGSEGNDVLVGGEGADTLDGGAGSGDMAGYWDAASGVAVNLATGVHGGAAAGDALVNIENIGGSTHDDTLTGSAGGNFIDGNTGNDTISGLEGDDVLVGGAGNDTLDGGAGVDSANYWSTANGVVANLATGSATGDGTDSLLNIENLGGSSHGDHFTGNDQMNVLAGNDGNDTLAGMGGNDWLVGGAGNDSLDGGAGTGDGADFQHPGIAAGVNVNLATGVVTGGAGNDTITGVENVFGTDFNDVIVGDGNVNFFEGRGGNDSIFGGGGRDNFAGGAGNDTLDGGAIVDRVAYSDLNTVSYQGSGPVNINLQTGVVQKGVGIGGGTDQLANINFVTGSAFHDVITGSNTSNLFEQFEGGTGNDTIDGGAIDALGTNANRVSYASAAAAVQVSLAAGTASGGAGNDVLININHVTGSVQNDTLTGSDSVVSEEFEGRGGNDTIDGMGGVDVVRFDGSGAAVNANLVTGVASDGWGGTDTLLNIEGLRGSHHNDTLTGGNAANDALEIFIGNGGNDTIDGGSGFDRVQYNSSTTGVNVTLGGAAAGTASDGLGGTDTLLNIEAVRGSAFDDTLTGSDAGGEEFEGRQGNDTIDGRGGVDTVTYAGASGTVHVDLRFGTALGGDGNDTLANIENVRGSAFADGLVGNDLANLLAGNGGDDTLFGLGGNDTLAGGAGDDQIYGGDGIDTASYRSAGGRVDVDLRPGTAVGAGGNDVLREIENVEGSEVGDGLVGNDEANVLSGNGGDDVFFSLGGNDTVNGGAGDDQIYGGDGIDTASYRSAGGRVDVDLRPGTAVGAGGNDVLREIENVEGSEVGDGLVGDDGVNVLSGLGGNDVFFSLGGNDTIDGGAGDDLIYGGEGADTVSYRSAAGRVDVDLRPGTSQGAGGNDVMHEIENVEGSEVGDGLVGNDAANVLSGLGGNDVFFSLGGDDTIDGGAGDDLIYGGEGRDTVSYRSATGRVDVDLRPGTSQGAGGNDVMHEIENVEGSEVGDGLVGNDAVNVLSGLGGNDVFFSLGGDDTIDGGAGDDLIYGGEGRDTVSYRSAGGRVDVDLRPGTSQGAGGNDVMHEIENVEGSEVGDGLVGNDAANVLSGLGGNDVFFSLGGNDTIDGGAGDDLIYGGEGADTVSYRSAAGRVDVDLRPGTSQGAGGNDVMHEIENVEGSEVGDGLVGNDAANVLSGLGGNDVFFGLGGNDTIDGGAGDDLIYGGEGRDTVSYRSAGGRVDVDLRPGTSQGAGGNDVMHEIENVEGSEVGDGLVGNDAANVLSGLGGNDVFFGLGGNDTLQGGAGGDVMYGGAGADVFAYLSAAEGGDAIGDFTSGSDVLAFQAAAFGGGNTGALQAGRFAGTSAGLGGQSGFVYDAGTGTLSFDADGAGAGAAVHIAGLGAGTALQASDILLT